MSRIRFKRRPMPIIAEYRPVYKIFQILLILEISSRGGKSSLIRLHLINWVLKSEDRKALLIGINNENIVPFKVWGVDPALNYALQISIYERLVVQKADSYSVTAKGKSLLSDAKSNGIDLVDFDYLSKLGKKVTEKMVLRVVDKWT